MTSKGWSIPFSNTGSSCFALEYARVATRGLSSRKSSARRQFPPENQANVEKLQRLHWTADDCVDGCALLLKRRPRRPGRRGGDGGVYRTGDCGMGGDSIRAPLSVEGGLGLASFLFALSRDQRPLGLLRGGGGGDFGGRSYEQ